MRPPAIGNRSHKVSRVPRAVPKKERLSSSTWEAFQGYFRVKKASLTFHSNRCPLHSYFFFLGFLIFFLFGGCQTSLEKRSNRAPNNFRFISFSSPSSSLQKAKSYFCGLLRSGYGSGKARKAPRPLRASYTTH